jgi:uncharacterized protein YqeY
MIEDQPMSIREQLTADMKDAMKAGDKRKLATVRLMLAAIKDKDINARTDGHAGCSLARAFCQDGETAPGFDCSL